MPSVSEADPELLGELGARPRRGSRSEYGSEFKYVRRDVDPES